MESPAEKEKMDGPFPYERTTPTGEWMFDLNKELLCSSITDEGETPNRDSNKESQHLSIREEGNTPSRELMFDLNKEILCSSITEEGKTSTIDLNKEVHRSSSLASLELLNKYGNRMKRANQDCHNASSKEKICNSAKRKELSTVEIMKIAIAKYMNVAHTSPGDVSTLILPFDGVHSGLSSEVVEDVELILLLLAAAKKVADKQFLRARKLLSMCNNLGSRLGNPVQRVVYYFAEALGDKIDRETGIASSDGLESIKRWQSRVIKDLTIGKPCAFVFRQQLPFTVACELAGIQVILDSMASAKRIHLIDLHFRSGSYCTMLIQALAVRGDCPLEMLKLTAIGTTSLEMIEATGRRLSTFAASMSLPFSFKIVMMSHEKDLSDDLFQSEAGEVVGVYSASLFGNVKERTGLIRVIKNLCPIVMVVIEAETDTNIPDFMDQCTEVLQYYCASFETLEWCMDRNDACRTILEGDYYRGGIQNVIRFEREDRITCHMKIDGWRSFFKRFGMVEKEMSTSSLYQASLMLERHVCGNSFTLEMNGKCLLLGWKGTPLVSLSAWSFLQPED